MADDERGDAGQEFGGDVDPADWRLLRLTAPRKDGTQSQVELLRPTAWLQARGARVGGGVHLDIRDCGILGYARVLAIEPCPAIAAGPGRVVTGTFHHPATKVLDVHVEGVPKPIGTTPNHQFWSEDRQAFIPADQLETDEQVLTLAGPAAVERIVTRPRAEDVYNLEIQVNHVYHVSAAGVLVHNANKPCPLANGTPDNPVQISPSKPPVEQSRDAAGKFAKKSGNEVRPDSNAESDAWDAIEKKTGWKVTREPIHVKDATGQVRVYDGYATTPSGRKVGLEVKSGTSKLTPSQRAFDNRLNSSRNNTATGVGKHQGLEIERAVEIRR